jgi:hypothetical protein
MSNSVEVTDTRAIVVGISGVVTIYDISPSAIAPLTVVSTFDPMLTGSDQAKGVAVTPDGTRAVVVYHNANTLIFNMNLGGTPVASLPGAGAGYGSAGGNLPSLDALKISNTHAVTIGCVGGGVKVYDIGSTIPTDITPVSISSLAPENYYDLEISPNGERALVISDNASTVSLTHAIDLISTGAVYTAALQASFAGLGTMDVNAGGYLRGLLEDTIVMTDEVAVLLGMSSTALGNVQVINFKPAVPVATNFTMTGTLHDLELDAGGARAIVHSSSQVQVFDITTTGAPTKLGPALPSPGLGMINLPHFNGSVNEFYTANTVVLHGDRAVVIGANVGPFSVVNSKVNTYDLGMSGTTPSLVQSFSTSQQFVTMTFHDMSLAPSGAVAAISSFNSRTMFVELQTGNVFSTEGGPGKMSPYCVHSVEASNTRAIGIGNSGNGTPLGTTVPRYTATAISQLPYASGNPIPNTSGSATTLSHTGDISMASNNFSLIATGLPTNGSGTSTIGMFFYSFGQISPMPLNDGLLYIGPSVYRMLPVLITQDPLTYHFDLNALPTGGGILPFEEVHIQLWYRDAASPGGANLSDVCTVSFGL